MPCEILVKEIYITECKISLASFTNILAHWVLRLGHTVHKTDRFWPLKWVRFSELSTILALGLIWLP